MYKWTRPFSKCLKKFTFVHFPSFPSVSFVPSQLQTFCLIKLLLFLSLHSVQAKLQKKVSAKCTAEGQTTLHAFGLQLSFPPPFLSSLFFSYIENQTSLENITDTDFINYRELKNL